MGKNSFNIFSFIGVFIVAGVIFTLNLRKGDLLCGGRK